MCFNGSCALIYKVTTASLICHTVGTLGWYFHWFQSGLPIMFIAGMVVQFCKTGKDSDHRQGNDKKNQTKTK